MYLPLPSISLPKLELNVESGSFSSDDSVHDLANPSVLAPADPAPSLKVSAQECNAQGQTASNTVCLYRYSESHVRTPSAGVPNLPDAPPETPSPPA